MALQVNNWQDIQNAIVETRQEFQKTTTPIKNLLESAVSVLFEALDLLSSVINKTDDETYTLKLHITAFGRIIAALATLESGFLDEAQMILRNAIELEIIGIDIFYNKASLDIWKKTDKEDLFLNGDWNIKVKNSYEKIKEDKKNIYPHYEIVHVEHLRKQWKKFSNMTIHVHSREQIDKLYTPEGHFSLIRRPNLGGCKQYFNTYQNIIFNISVHLYEILKRPKYLNLINKNKDLLNKANTFHKNYIRLKEEIKTKEKMRKENSIEVSIFNSQYKEIMVSPAIKTTLDMLGVEALNAGLDENQVVIKMLQFLANNGFESTKLKAEVTHEETESGKKISDITIYYSN